MTKNVSVSPCFDRLSMTKNVSMSPCFDRLSMTKKCHPELVEGWAIEGSGWETFPRRGALDTRRTTTG